MKHDWSDWVLFIAGVLTVGIGWASGVATNEYDRATFYVLTGLVSIWWSGIDLRNQP